MTEPDVAITDYLLAIESLVLAMWLAGQLTGRPDLQRCFVVFFAATALASALGGTVHGFFLARSSRTGVVLWRAALIAIGVVAAAGWLIGTRVLGGSAQSGVILVVVAVEFIAYALVVTTVSDAFWVAIANYVPSTAFLAVAYWTAYRSDPHPAMALGLAGLALTFAAAVGQRLRIAIHPVYFNHNAVYHAVQGIALFLIFWSGRYLIGQTGFSSLAPAGNLL
jgi:hypothetical protein